jgi:hypothetical protein
MYLSSIEIQLMTFLSNNGPISGAAQVGFALWPRRRIKCCGAAFAAGKILNRLNASGCVAISRGIPKAKLLTRYAMTDVGRAALAAEVKVTMVQLLLFPHDTGRLHRRRPIQRTSVITVSLDILRG